MLFGDRERKPELVTMLAGAPGHPVDMRTVGVLDTFTRRRKMGLGDGEALVAE